MNFIAHSWQPSHSFTPYYRGPSLTFTGEGVFYQLKKNGPEIIYDTAKISFESNREEFSYQLNIEDLDVRPKKRADKENMMSEYGFKISEKLNLYMYEKNRNEDITAFEWQSDNKSTSSFMSLTFCRIIYGFEFRNKKRDLATAKTFKELICKLIYQTKHRTYVSEDISSAYYLCFCQSKDETFSKAKSSKLVVRDNCFSLFGKDKIDKMDVEIEPYQNKSKLIIESSGFKEREPNVSNQKSTFSFSGLEYNRNSEYKPTIKKEFVFKEQGGLYQLDETYQFLKMQDSAVLCLRRLEVKSHQLEIYCLKNNLLYLQMIEDDSSYSFDFEGGCFKWVDLQDETLRIFAFKLAHDSQKQLEKLRNILGNSQSVSQSEQVCEISSFKDPISSFQGSAIKANLLARYEEVSEAYQENLGSIEEIFGESVCENSDQDAEENREDQEEEAEFCFEDEGEEILDYKKIYKYFEPKNTNSYPNNVISQSKILNRVFVSRGPVISVFKAENSLEFVCNLPHLDASINQLIHPKKILFYHEDTRMLILDQHVDNRIYSLDLEKGLITNEWILDEKQSILDLEHLIKNGELFDNDLFIGFNHKNVFQFDPNQQKASISVKNYTSNPRFSCFSTTNQGTFAIGSLGGDIRLFKEVGKNAKNLITECEGQIIGVDSSKNGEFLAVTTENEIFIYQTHIDGINGYLTSLKKNKSLPIHKLFLPEEIIQKYHLEGIKFTKAKFDNVHDEPEQCVLSTMGRLLIIWNLDDVYQNINEPKIYELNSTILDCNFKDNRKDGVIVVLKDEVDYILI